ncbi:exopolysaccharide biosynthesis protein [Aquisalimonas sp.]|uniref:exopolysaccharide biosynthesis protein n=1 Tax=Aquisalimonas sp. TaxID=1872621 RepID=UPI0025B8E958|nr:exopolysaccharide biosynthesis protein [Aquisalimonas sp.]
MKEGARTLGDIVDDITKGGADEQEVEGRQILESVGQRSFGPILLVPGLLVLSPLSGVPGVPTIGAIVVLLITGQVLLGHQCFWVPEFILRRRISRERLTKARRFLAPIARFVDTFIKPRLLRLTRRPFNYVIAGACALLAVMMPPLEAIPLANVVTAAGISAFGLGLTTDDGVLVLLGFALTAASLYFLLTVLL